MEAKDRRQGARALIATAEVAREVAAVARRVAVVMHQVAQEVRLETDSSATSDVSYLVAVVLRHQTSRQV